MKISNFNKAWKGQEVPVEKSMKTVNKFKQGWQDGFKKATSDDIYSDALAYFKMGKTKDGILKALKKLYPYTVVGQLEENVDKAEHDFKIG